MDTNQPGADTDGDDDFLYAFCDLVIDGGGKSQESADLLHDLAMDIPTSESLKLIAALCEGIADRPKEPEPSKTRSG